ncbi:hypothetical protein H2248_011498 [Termitomyces sp. 'cryptogamus']|nr:hypothetical protein H2248_011498 [Termitomyces sp. 'cryptogamus']
MPTPVTTRQVSKQQQPSIALPGILPATPSPLSFPPPKKEPKEESSPTTSEAETLATLHLTIPSSPTISDSGLLGTYCLLHITTNQNQQKMSSTLPFHINTDKQCPLAKVKVTKLRDCPMLTKGHMENNIFQQWLIACH